MDEFYHKDLFGATVDVNLSAVADEGEVPLFDKQGRIFNVFVLTDALGARRKKEAWILYQKALFSGISADEIFFKIFWQVKSMLIALRTKSVRETDMKPFPYNKAKGFLKNFQSGELEILSEDLVIGYIQARRGKGEVGALVEKTLLNL